jgi:hypothetical protein
MKNTIQGAGMLLVLGFVALVCTPAWSSVTYTYTGNPFTSWAQGFQCPPVCGAVGSFTVAQPLAPNLPELTDVGAISATLTSGGVTVTLASSVPNQSNVAVSTDGSGNIVYFSLVLYGSGPNTARIAVQYSTALTFDDIHYIDSNSHLGPIAGINRDDPGTWSVTPEPSSLFLLGSGLIGIVGVIAGRGLSYRLGLWRANSMRAHVTRMALCFLGFVVASGNAPAVAQATNAALSGTYTMVYGSVDNITIQSNMFGQQVGFCSNASGQIPFNAIPFDYGCPSVTEQTVTTATFIADGKGNITGGTYVLTPDPNSYQCTYNKAPDCPYKVPAGISWNSTTKYVVGDEVDEMVNGKMLTFQAVKNNTNLPPSLSTCNQNTWPNCDWVQLHVNATGKNVSGSGTLSGTYNVQSNGSAVMQVTAMSGTKKLQLSYAFVVPTAPLAVGQEVPIVGMSTLGTFNHGTGVAVRTQ